MQDSSTNKQLCNTHTQETSQYTYSVVIPHYNSAELLKVMLASIPERDDIQVIVCDDGSTPEQVALIRQLAHKNLELVLLKHGGPGYPRNEGIRRAKGKWFISVDADDYFAPEAFDVFDREITRPDMDMLVFCIKVQPYTYPDGRQADIKNIRSTKVLYAYLKNPNTKTETALRFGNISPWNKLVRMSLITKNNIVFAEAINDEPLYVVHLGLKAKHIHVIPDELYVVVTYPESITRQKRDIERQFQFYLAKQSPEEFYKKLGLFKWERLKKSAIPYTLFVLKRYGFSGMLKFIKMLFTRRDEIREARKAYLYLLEDKA